MGGLTISLPMPAPREPLPSFGSWLKSKLNVVTVPVAIALASLLLNLSKAVPAQAQPEWIFQHGESTLHCLHALLIVTLFFLVPQGFQTNNSKYALTVLAANRFRTAWQLTLLAWLLLYGSLIVKSLGIVSKEAGPMLGFMVDGLNCLSTVGFWFCFITVSNPDQKGDPIKWIGVVCAVLIADLIGTLSDIDSLRFISQVFIAGLSGIAMAFFVGRLESRLLRPPRWLLGALYGYASLQFGYAFLGTQSELRESIFYFAALAFKILLALFVNWLIGTGNLLFYLHYMSELNHDYSEKRTTFMSEITE